MSDPTPISLKWSTQLSLAPHNPTSSTLPGDKILLPPSALEQLLSAATVITLDDPTSTPPSGPSTTTFDPFNPHTYAAERHARAVQQQYQAPSRQQQLPHPLIFRLVNPNNGRIVYAGIREFSADDGFVVLSSFLRHSLGLDGGENKPKTNETGEEEEHRITVHAAQIPKGTYVRFRPLEAGYDPEDWKSLLEQHLRANYTTLTNGEILAMPGARKGEEFRFLIDKVAPEGDAICVVDTDLEVDIEALNEEQARETLRRRAAKLQVAPGTKGGSSTGGELKLAERQAGQVLEGDYVDYRILAWDRTQPLEIVLEADEADDEIDLFVSPLSPHQRAKPRDDEHIFGEITSHYPKRITLDASNPALQDAEEIWVSVHGYRPPSPTSSPPSTQPLHYHLLATPLSTTSTSPPSPSEDSTNPLCPNCHLPIPPQTLPLHTAFCTRNNIPCPICRRVFLRSSPSWQHHWHCPICPDISGDTALSQTKHDSLQHPSNPFPCPSCPFTAPSLPLLATHRTTLCPGKHIICRFCHLSVPQQPPPYNPTHPTLEVEESLLLNSGLTPHEVEDGARTTDCHVCSRHVRLRDFAAHLRHHALENAGRPTPAICRNELCGRTLGGLSSGKDGARAPPTGQAERDGKEARMGLCGTCYAPLYAPVYDPEGKAMRRRVERRYLTQLTKGCGREWCRNEWCKTGRKNGGKSEVGVKDATALVKPLLTALDRENGDGVEGGKFEFCVDEAAQGRRAMAEVLAGDEEGYELGWWIAALEANGGGVEGGRAWLEKWAATRSARSG